MPTTAPFDIPATVQLLDIKQLAAATGEGHTTIYEKVRAGKFPKPIKIGRKNKWRLSTIKAHLERLDRKAGNL